jgi:hypothetical protein
MTPGSMRISDVVAGGWDAHRDPLRWDRTLTAAAKPTSTLAVAV